MLTVDKALSAYADMLNTDANVDLQYFNDNLSEEDYAEFLKMAGFINSLTSLKISDKFESAFAHVNERRGNMLKEKGFCKCE